MAKTVHMMDELASVPFKYSNLAKIMNLIPETTAIKFAAACARSTLPYFESKYTDDMRPRLAVEAAERYSVDPCHQRQVEALAAFNAAKACADDIFYNLHSSTPSYGDLTASNAAFAAADAALAAATKTMDRAHYITKVARTTIYARSYAEDISDAHYDDFCIQCEEDMMAVLRDLIVQDLERQGFDAWLIAATIL